MRLTNKLGLQKALTASDATYPDGTLGLEVKGTTGRLDDFAAQAVGESAAYDDASRLSSLTRGSDTFSYLYDLAGNITRRTYPDGTQATYAYDDAERLESVTSGGVTTSYAYDPAGDLTQTTLPTGNGYQQLRTYDRADRVTDVENTNGTVLSDFAYTLDPVGNPTEVVRTGSLPETETFTYDASDRLTGVCFQSGTCPGGSDPFIRWTYDPVGNRLTETRPAGQTSYSYNSGDELTSRSGLGGSVSYNYDQNGNETAAGSGTFTYDLTNRLASTTLSGQTTNYEYSGDGERLRASTGTQASEQTTFRWDTTFSLPQLALERDGQGTLRRRYLYGSDLVSMTTSAGTYYPLTDRLGSVTDVTSSSGTAEWTYSYEPFGTTRTETKDDSSAPDNFVKFTGEYLDPIGLYYLRARAYDPASGRLQTQDPIQSLSGGTPVQSPYSYAADEPTLLTDPSGLFAMPPEQSTVDAFTTTSAVDSLADTPPTLSCVPCRRSQALSLSVGQRTGILRSFFYDFPGKSTGKEGLGYGHAVVDFLRWEIGSGRVSNGAGSGWWKLVNGLLALDVQDAHRALKRGTKRVADSRIQSWVAYAIYGGSSSASEQRLLWTAHQRSLHCGIALGWAPWFGAESVTEQKFIDLGIRFVDLAALSNKSTASSEIGGFIGAEYPGRYPASTSDVTRVGNLLNLAATVGYLPTIGNLGVKNAKNIGTDPPILRWAC